MEEMRILTCEERICFFEKFIFSTVSYFFHIYVLLWFYCPRETNQYKEAEETPFLKRLFPDGETKKLCFHLSLLFK